LKIAVIGVGRMGCRHIQAVKKLGFQLVGIVDSSLDAQKAACLEQDLPESISYTTMQELFDVVLPDCVIISTTADSHCKLTCFSAKQGVKYILVEKPLATSLAESELMIRTCESNQSLLSVNHQMRFMDQYLIPKSLLNSTDYGGIKSMTVVAGNFGMAMNATHYFEAFRFLTDEEPSDVTAWFSDDLVENPRGEQFHDRAGEIRVTTKSQKRLYIEIGSDQGHGVQVTYAARNGLISVNELTGSMITTVREKDYLGLPTTRYGMPAINSSQIIPAAEVIDSSASVLKALINNENVVTANHGLLTIKILVAAYTSAENKNRKIGLEESLDYDRIFPWA